MRTYRQAKAMAKSLRESLALRHVDLTHGDCLELVAKQFGFVDWNVLAAKLRVGAAPDQPPESLVSLEPPIPVISVASLPEAREFYVGFLGFAFDWGDEDLAESSYAQVSRDGVQLHLAAAAHGARPCTLLFRDMGGIDTLHGELRARAGRFAPTPIQFTPWDSREFQVRDPFGNLLRFWENNPPGVAR
jgi:catechol 2,3-dioxygenase-like lactoylglutathione lyase family enzyme